VSLNIFAIFCFRHQETFKFKGQLSFPGHCPGHLVRALLMVEAVEVAFCAVAVMVVDLGVRARAVVVVAFSTS
jgi:hypothetical protein